MAFDLQTFYAAAQANEFARDFQFYIETLGPLNEDDKIYMTTTELPGLGIHDQVVTFNGHQFHLPGTCDYQGNGSWTVTFHCDEGQNIREKLIAWQKEIFSFETSSGKYGVPVETAVIKLRGKNPGVATRAFELVGIYPVTVGNVSYDVQGSGAPVSIQVTFAYQYWRERSAAG
jgi:hypothetical protein